MYLKGLSLKPYQQALLLALLIVLVTFAGIGIYGFIFQGMPLLAPPPQNSATPVVNYFATYVAEGRELGQAYIKAPDRVFMRVNGIAVNYREYAERKSQYASHLRERDDGYETIGEFLDKYGVDAGALGSLIMDYALYSSALDAGFGMSDSEMAEIFGGDRDSEGHGRGNPGSVGWAKGYISVLGKEVFWNDIVLPRTRRLFVVQDWLEATLPENPPREVTEQRPITLVENAPVVSQRRKALEALYEEALSKATIQILDDTDLSTTVEEALSFIRAYNAAIYESE